MFVNKVFNIGNGFKIVNRIIFRVCLFVLFLLFNINDGWGQTTVFSESVGTPSATTLITSYTGWDNNGVYSFTGSGDVRTSTASSGYTGASGSGNVFLTNTVGKDFQIEGISTIGMTNISISFGAYKSTTASDMSELVLEYSTDGSIYNTISFPAQPTGTGTATWRLISNISVPAGAENQANLRIRWRQTSTTPQFRIDDVTLVYFPVCTYPTTQASVLSFSNISTTSMTIGWVNGDGSNRIVLVKSGSSVDSDPIDNTSYTANTIFGSGSQIGTGNYVVYNGTSNSVTITGLSVGTNYYVAVYEFNLASFCYLTSLPLTGNQVSASSSSDVISLSSTEAVSISSLMNDASPLSSTTGVQVWKIRIRDGGLSLNDIDNLPTIVTSLTIAQGSGNQVDNWQTSINAFDLFDGTTHIASATINPTQILFTGLNISVADNSYKNLSFRLSLKTTLNTDGNNDGDDFQFSLSNANVTLASTGSSQKSGFSAMSSANGMNVIDITATKLQFNQQPSDASVNAYMLPNNISVSATDPNGNVDLGFVGNITITSTGSLNNSPLSFTAAAGVASLSDPIIHTASGSGLVLTASSSGLTSATSNTFNIVDATVLSQGDLVIVGFDTWVLSGIDKIVISNLVDLAPKTQFILSNTVFEYGAAAGERTNLWFDGNGNPTTNNVSFIAITYNGGSAISAGSVICITLASIGYIDHIDINGTLSGDFIDDGNQFVQFSSSAPDAIFLSQGYYSDPMYGGDCGAGIYCRSFTGTVLGAIQSRGTFTDLSVPGPSGSGDLARISRIHPAIECLSFSTGGASSAYYAYYDPAKTHSGTQHDILTSISNTSTNWLSGEGAATEDVDDVPTCNNTFTVTVSCVPGKWLGTSDDNWFYCSNWDNFSVPDSNVNVTLTGTATNDAVIDATAAYSDKFGDIAQGKNITIENGVSLTVQNAASTLEVFGNFQNDGIYTHSDGWAIFKGYIAQSILGNNACSFYNLKINNSSNEGITLSTNDATVTNELNLSDGVITTGTNNLILSNNVVTSLTGGSSSSFVNGNFRRAVTSNTDMYEFPVGNGTAATDFKKFNYLNNNLTNLNNLDVSVTSISESGNNVDSRLNMTQDGTLLNDLVSSAIWSVKPNVPTSWSYSSGSYGVSLYVANTGLSSADDNAFCPVKRPDLSTDYADWSTFVTEEGTVIPAQDADGRIYNGGAGYAKRTGYKSFSEHAIVKGIFVLPIDLINFNAFAIDNKVNIEWITASEINNDYFNIERSNNGVKFNTIGKVNGFGNSSAKNYYSFIDKTPLKGLSYYRLKQVDFDGAHSYSNIAILNINNGLSIENIYNSESATTLIIANHSKAAFTLRITDMSGKIIYAEKLNSISENIMLELEKGRISSGVYNIHLYNNEDMVNKRIVVF